MVVLMLVSALCGAVYQTEGCCCITLFCDLADEADEMADVLANLRLRGYNIGVRRRVSRSRRIQDVSKESRVQDVCKEVSVEELRGCIKNPDEDVCSICLDKFLGGGGKVVKLECEHMYHEKCIEPWIIKDNTNCPLCRRAFVTLGSNNNERENEE